VDDSKQPVASKWLVDSGASIHVTNECSDLNEPEATSQSVTIGSSKVMAAQFKVQKATVLVDMTGNTLELEDMLCIPNFKKKIVSLSKLLDQGYEVDKCTKSHLKISKHSKNIIIKQKESQQMFYLLGFKVQPKVHVLGQAMDLNDVHEQLGHCRRRHPTKNNAFLWSQVNWHIGSMQWMHASKSQIQKY